MITIENKGQNIFIFSRKEDGTPTIEKIPNFEAYFCKENPFGSEVAIDGTKLEKVMCGHPENVKIERDKYNKTWESDVLFINRFIIDKIREIPKVPLRICYLDIETKRTKNGYESPEVANNPILAICCYDNFDKKYTSLCLTKTHQTEKEMLAAFIKYIQETNPDILIAWNGDNFDFPFLVNRIKKLGLDDNLLARQCIEKGFVGKCHNIANGYKITQIQGRIPFDLMYAYKKIYSNEGRDSWSLDYISNYEGLGGKEEYKGELDNLFKEDIDKFIAYNKRDVELMVLINEKLRLVEFFDEMRRMCFCRFVDVFMNSKMADTLCLKYAFDHKFRLPRSVDNAKEAYTGGFVRESTPKLHKNIAVMDMKSLYPSIMIGFNMSYETLLKNKDDNCINIDNKFFFKKDRGIFPSIVKPLLQRRAEISKEMSEIEKTQGKESREYKTLWMKQYALKVIANSFYGVLGFKKFRLYKNEVAQSITYTAQKIIKEVHSWFEKKGLNVIYGDTDSVFIEMGNKSIDELKELNKEINRYFKIYFMEYGVEEENNIFKLEFESVYKTLLFKMGISGKGVKKKYAGRVVWEDGKQVDYIKIKGFESRRSDSPLIGRELIKNVLKMIVYEDSKENIDKYVEEFKTKILNGEFTAEQLAIPIGISKPLEQYGNQIHAKAARLANEKHKAQIQQGDKIKYIYVKTPEKVIAFKSGKYMWDDYKIDYNKMIRRIIDLKIGPLYHGLGWAYVGLIFKKEKELKFEDKLKQLKLWN